MPQLKSSSIIKVNIYFDVFIDWVINWGRCRYGIPEILSSSYRELPNCDRPFWNSETELFSTMPIMLGSHPWKVPTKYQHKTIFWIFVPWGAFWAFVETVNLVHITLGSIFGNYFIKLKEEQNWEEHFMDGIVPVPDGRGWSLASAGVLGLSVSGPNGPQPSVGARKRSA